MDIIVPVFNEANNIEKVFDAISKNIKHDKRVYIIYDFDEDNTLPVVNSVMMNYPFEIVLHKNTLGKGVLNAIKSGFNVAEDDKILVVMADLSDRLSDVDLMADKMDDGNGVVCGSRYMRGGRKHGGPFFKGFFSRLAGLTLHLLSGIPTHDVTNSFKMYSKKVLDSINIESIGGFEIGMEITVKAYINGYKIDEVPTEWYDRIEGESNFHMKEWLPHYLHWYFYCIKYSWLKRIRGRHK